MALQGGSRSLARFLRGNARRAGVRAKKTLKVERQGWDEGDHPSLLSPIRLIWSVRGIMKQLSVVSVRGEHTARIHPPPPPISPFLLLHTISNHPSLPSSPRLSLVSKVGYTCSAGIGCSKMAAKLAGELYKPDQQTTILPE